MRIVGQVTPVTQRMRLVRAAIAPSTDHTKGLWPCSSFQGWKWSEIQPAWNPAASAFAAASTSSGPVRSSDESAMPICAMRRTFRGARQSKPTACGARSGEQVVQRERRSQVADGELLVGGVRDDLLQPAAREGVAAGRPGEIAAGDGQLVDALTRAEVAGERGRVDAAHEEADVHAQRRVGAPGRRERPDE